MMYVLIITLLENSALVIQWVGRHMYVWSQSMRGTTQETSSVLSKHALY